MRVSLVFCLLLMVCIHGLILCDPAKEQKEKKRRKGRKSKKNKRIKDTNYVSKCLKERKDAIERSRLFKPEVVIPACRSDGFYNEIQCHTSTGFCWCVNKEGVHIPGTSLKGRKPNCKAGKRRRKKERGGKTKKRKRCNSKDRQNFNTALIKVFKAEYDRANVTPPPPGKGDDFGPEKAIVEWKFVELDTNKDGKLPFKEIRTFSRMVKKLIRPKGCARRFLDYCDKKRDRTIEKAEWTLCLGVDIKPNNNGKPNKSPLGSVRAGGLNVLPVGGLPTLISNPSSAPVKNKVPNKPVPPPTCTEEREAARKIHSQEPNAKHYIPMCSSHGTWEKVQCHPSTGYCWCVKETNGVPIPGTATYRVTPNCTFDDEREIPGCPFQQKRRFLVDLVAELTQELRRAETKEGKSLSADFGGNVSLKEKVARWKLKSLDKNNNGVMDKKEWKPLRKKTLKNKAFPPFCRKGFLRYCDANTDKDITMDEWKDCLGLNHNFSSSLPINPKRKGKNPFVDQLQ